MKTPGGGKLFLAALVSALVLAPWTEGSAREGESGGLDQRRSVVYVRGIRPFAETLDLYRQLRPDSLMSAHFGADTRRQRAAFFQWGGKYLLHWGGAAVYCDWPVSEPGTQPGSLTFDRTLFDHWAEHKKAGLVTGDHPGSPYEHTALPRSYVEGLRDRVGARYVQALGGEEELAARSVPWQERSPGKNQYHLCLNDPVVLRINLDLTRFMARGGPGSGGFGKIFNTSFLDGVASECYCAHCHREFDRWIRERLEPEEIRALLEADPEKPISMLAPTKDPDLDRVYNCLHRQFFARNLGDFFRSLREAGESIVGKGNWRFVMNTAVDKWRQFAQVGALPVWWGDVIDPFIEPAWISGESRSPDSFAAPFRYDFLTNLFTYQYGAGRLWGEPLVTKPRMGPLQRNPMRAQLGMAEGLALIGNYAIYPLDPGGEPDNDYTNPAWVKPMAWFAYRIKARFRQMIPAGEVAVLFSPVDSLCAEGLSKAGEWNRSWEEAKEVSDALGRQHVSFQMVHLTLFDRVLRQRPFRTLIIPGTRCVSDDQAASIRSFVEGGGRVVFIRDECGTHTSEGARRKRSVFADLLPGTAKGKVTDRKVKKGRTALIPETLVHGSTTSAMHLQEALFSVTGASPSLTGPDQCPNLLLNLTRNSDRSRYWMSLLNYAVDMSVVEEEMDPAQAAALRRIGSIRVVIPLPEGITAESVTLLRPGQRDLKLKPKHGKEGCAVTVPGIDIIALLEVVSRDGERPPKTLLDATNLKTALEMVADTGRAVASRKELVRPSGNLRKVAPDGVDRTYYSVPGGPPVIVYVDPGGAEKLQMRLHVDDPYTPQPFYSVYAMDGELVGERAVENHSDGVETIRLSGTGIHAAVLRLGRHARVSFPRAKSISFEASRGNPLTVEARNFGTLFLHVPKGCRSLVVGYRADLKGGSPGIRLRDGEGRLVLDHESPEGVRSEELSIEVDERSAGAVWSLELLEVQTGRYGLFLEGVPPLLAESPHLLLTEAGR